MTPAPDLEQPAVDVLAGHPPAGGLQVDAGKVPAGVDLPGLIGEDAHDVLVRYQPVVVRAVGKKPLIALLCDRGHGMSGKTVTIPTCVRTAQAGDVTAVPDADWIIDQRDMSLAELVEHAFEHETQDH